MKSESHSLTNDRSRRDKSYRIAGFPTGLAGSALLLICCGTASAREAEVFLQTGSHESGGEKSEQAPSAPVRAGRALDIVGTPLRSSAISVNLAKSHDSPIRGTLPDRSPLTRFTLTSRFGMRTHPVLWGRRMHSGVDLAAPQGTPVLATGGGVVVSSGWQGGYGLAVVVRHGASSWSRYAHLSRISVRLGQTVTAGDVLGLVGSTGRSTGPHLHYETIVGGKAVDPLRIRP